jgi:outer membrane lipoprotein-sorting protein
MRLTLRPFLMVLLMACQTSLIAQNPAKPIMDKMLVQMSKVLSASARVKRAERINGKIVTGEMRFKAMFSPTLKVYINITDPNEGTEVLYVKGWNNDDAFVNPNRFPWINVSLDPEGSIMMEDQHHSLFCVGFSFTEGVVRYVYDKHKEDFDDHVFYMGQEKWNSRMVHVVKIIYPDYGVNNYTIKNEKSLAELERKIFVPAAKILELNPTVDDYWDIKPGQVIRIPNAYGKESIFMIDTEHFLPIVQIVNDDKGLLEKYEYHDLLVNPRFNTAEFTKDFPGYGF